MCAPHLSERGNEFIFRHFPEELKCFLCKAKVEGRQTFTRLAKKSCHLTQAKTFRDFCQLELNLYQLTGWNRLTIMNVHRESQRENKKGEKILAKLHKRLNQIHRNLF